MVTWLIINNRYKRNRCSSGGRDGSGCLDDLGRDNWHEMCGGRHLERGLRLTCALEIRSPLTLDRSHRLLNRNRHHTNRNRVTGHGREFVNHDGNRVLVNISIDRRQGHFGLRVRVRRRLGGEHGGETFSITSHARRLPDETRRT